MIRWSSSLPDRWSSIYIREYSSNLELLKLASLKKKLSSGLGGTSIADTPNRTRILANRNGSPLSGSNGTAYAACRTEKEKKQQHFNLDTTARIGSTNLPFCATQEKRLLHMKFISRKNNQLSITTFRCGTHQYVWKKSSKSFPILRALSLTTKRFSDHLAR